MIFAHKRLRQADLEKRLRQNTRGMREKTGRTDRTDEGGDRRGKEPPESGNPAS